MPIEEHITSIPFSNSATVKRVPLGWLCRSRMFQRLAMGPFAEPSQAFIQLTPFSAENRVGGAEFLMTELPTPARIDHYAWYYGSLAAFQMGEQYWRTWNPALRRALLPSRRTSGCARGSWDVHDDHDRMGGRVYTTAINVLPLEVYFRYPRVFR